MPGSVSLIELVRVVQETWQITIRTQVILTHRQDGEVLTQSEGFVMSPRVMDLEREHRRVSLGESRERQAVQKVLSWLSLRHIN